MIVTQQRRQHALWLLALISSFGLAASVGVRLASHGVPFPLISACALSVAASALELLRRLLHAWSTTTHRCSADGCAFAVTVQGVDAAENRYWQEVSAAHPDHTA